MMLRIFLIALFAVSSASFAAEPSPWEGTYVYTYKGEHEKNTPGTTYILTLDPLSAKMPCQLSLQDFQTDETILCSVILNGTEADILFKSFGNERLVNSRGEKVYDAGDLLFTLLKPKKQLVTRWNKLTPADKVTKGRYFKKTSD